jgi:hypothetical protein
VLGVAHEVVRGGASCLYDGKALVKAANLAEQVQSGLWVPWKEYGAMWMVGV